MGKFLSFVLCAVLLSATSTLALPTPLDGTVVVSNSSRTASGSATMSAIPASETVALASDDPNYVMWNTTATSDSSLQPVRVEGTSSNTMYLQPMRGTLGTTILGQQNMALQAQNPDIIAPPTTDSGVIPGGNIKWPMTLSPMRLQTGGWARQQNINQMPIATSMAGVDMRLEAGAIRELHWHKTAEWAYVLSGNMQVTSVDQDGRNYLGNVGPGDLWYFPSGIPHSLQATNEDPNGVEFLLVFDNGDFSDYSTFQLTDWLAHTPKEVIAKNFGTSLSAWDQLPGEELYIFPGNSPSPGAHVVEDPYGQVLNPFTFKMSNMTTTPLAGGSVKIVDSRTFPAATAIAVAEVTVEPGGMRELHWHPTEDEWTYYLSGTARSSSCLRFDLTLFVYAGDVGFVPATYGHYVENIGNDTLKFLEIFNTDIFQDVSLAQWLALIPPQLVQAHLQISNETIAGFNKTKQVVVGPN
ncbi:uncharacterized protein FIBRA_08686 [Fibroporia radiculosa]|uniref:Cupin type-1 domain-containing protein n=1 Tax=Fibroporia radiculosa TaxID=599839 RepID=J4GX93_9APHY|nr:uncharacterized protein FIBRA_08686 [Fibroporia radiculosa]CCM06425.1 predicted protein [Fibroporia radiculosa]